MERFNKPSKIITPPQPTLPCSKIPSSLSPSSTSHPVYLLLPPSNHHWPRASQNTGPRPTPTPPNPRLLSSSHLFSPLHKPLHTLTHPLTFITQSQSHHLLPCLLKMATTTLLYSLVLLLLLAHPISSQLISSISASPSTLPSYPASISPALSPDLMPLYPSPKSGGAASSPEGALPTIPSSPSPPNPDGLEPHSAFAPAGSEAVSSAVRGSLVNLVAGASSGLVMIMWWLEVGLVAIF